MSQTIGLAIFLYNSFNADKFEKLFPKSLCIALNKLYDKGFSAYVVGGAIRDHLWGLNPKDFDLSTNATPEEVQAIFTDYKLVNIGINFGTITVVIEKQAYDICTFRTETFRDLGNPPKIEYVKTIEEDVVRRDLTINALYYCSKTKKLIDPSGLALQDIAKKQLRMLGDPEKRLLEDGNRIIRIVRFRAKFNLYIEDTLYNAILKKGYRVAIIKESFILNELLRLFELKDVKCSVKLLFESKIFQRIFSSVEKDRRKVLSPCKQEVVWKIKSQNKWIKFYALLLCLFPTNKFDKVIRNIKLNRKHKSLLLRYNLGRKIFKESIKNKTIKKWVRKIGINHSQYLAEYIMLNEECEPQSDILTIKEEVLGQVDYWSNKFRG